ncbi:MAG: permease-like cell division protein FtsX, partial [Hungatella sp.]
MRISTFWYCLKQGVINICRNIWFSLASIATISACIFLFCLFFSIIVNIRYVVKNAEAKIGSEIQTRSEIQKMEYTSAAEAWEAFQQDYFEGSEDMAEGFADDNPLAGSASYQIFLKDISNQDMMVKYLESLEGVRKVNYSNSAAAGLSSFNKVIGILSVLIIGVLLAVSIFLISNTINVAAAFRKTENQIMRLIGATNYMIRAPFVVEGVLFGLLGAVLPLIGMYYLYCYAVVYIVEKFQILSSIFQFLPVQTIFPYMAGTSLL